MAEPLKDTLARTGFRASLAPEYAGGEAPAAQRKDGHLAPPAPTYHDLPALRRPQWKWPIPAYFFVGGAGAGAYIAATLADLRGRPEDRRVVRAGRLVALLGMLASPALLIADLGRPERWYNMVRVFRPRSMMNQGAWALSLMGAFSALGAAVEALHAWAPRRRAARLAVGPLRVLSWLGLVPATYVASYTALLLTATNAPLWAGARFSLGPLFFSSALSTGLAATHLAARAAGPLPPRSEQRLKRAESLVTGAEVALVGATLSELRSLSRPLLRGRLGLAFAVGSVGLGMLAPLALKRAGGTLGLAAPALTLLGGLVLRHAIVVAGQKSADDPREYFEYTERTS